MELESLLAVTTDDKVRRRIPANSRVMFPPRVWALVTYLCRRLSRPPSILLSVWYAREADHRDKPGAAGGNRWLGHPTQRSLIW